MPEHINRPDTEADYRTEPEPLHVAAGDFRDDDGTIIDEAFEGNPNPTLPGSWPGRPSSPEITLDDKVLKTSRLLTRALTIGAQVATGRVLTPYDPVQVFPADPRRKFLRLRLGFKPLWAVPYADPAAGSTFATLFTLTSPAHIKQVRALLTTDANVATRTLFISYALPPQTSVNDMRIGTNAGTQAASLNNVWSWHETGAAQANGALVSTFPAGGLDLPVNTAFSLRLGSGQAGDQISQIQVVENTHLWRVAGDKSDCFGAPDYDNDYVYESDCHTGPVWVYAPYSVGDCQLVAESVTE